jgi:hypothetical protein
MDAFSSTPSTGSAAFALRGDSAKTSGSARGGAGGTHRSLTVIRISQRTATESGHGVTGRDMET